MTVINISLFTMELSATTEAENQANIKVRVPKRVLHFSDGVLEEYSDDETDNQSPTQQQIVDPVSNLTFRLFICLPSSAIYD